MSKKLNISRGLQGWSVRIVRDGEEYSKYFRFSDGGVRKSLSNAVAYRDAIMEELGPRTWKKGPRRIAQNNTSGTTGVSKNKYGRWVASWQQEGVQRFKTFKSRRAAVAHRKAMVAEHARTD